MDCVGLLFCSSASLVLPPRILIVFKTYKSFEPNPVDPAQLNDLLLGFARCGVIVTNVKVRVILFFLQLLTGYFGLIEWSIDLWNDWLMDWPVDDWLIDVLLYWSLNWFTDCLSDRLIHRLIGWLVKWLVCWLTDWLSDLWLMSSFTEWSIRWLSDWWVVSLINLLTD